MDRCILHATDLQDNHLNYCEQAVKIAKLFKAELYFLHVLDIPNSWQIAQGLGFAENEPFPIEETRMIMNALAYQFELPKNNMLVMHGNLRSCIIECIENLQPEILLIGSTSNQLMQGEFTHLSHFIVDHAPCDVMMLRPK